MTAELTTPVSQPQKYFQYDANGKVVAVARDALFQNLVAQFVYDEKGNRIVKKSYNTSFQLAQVTYYVDGVVYIQNITTSGPITLQEYAIDGGGDRIGTYYPQTPQYAYELKDHLGNVRAVVASSANGANVTMFNDYYPFGLVLRSGGVNYRYGYQGQNAEADGETGLNAFNLRMYDPTIGRWLITDPEMQHYSPYLAMGNNPVNNTDVTGGEDGDENDMSDASANESASATFIPPTTPGNFVNGQIYTDADGSWRYNNGQWEGIGDSWGDNYHIDDKTLDDIVITATKPIDFYSLWNSDAVRDITPDFINVGAGFNFIFGTFGGASIEANFVIHGPHASWKPIITTTMSLGVGYSIGATWNLGVASYSGKASDIRRNMVQTQTLGGTDIPTAWTSYAFAEGLKLGGTSTISKLNDGNMIVGQQLNWGAGLGVGPIPVNGAAGVSNTFILWDFDK